MPTWEIVPIIILRNKQKRVINLVFYAQSTSTVISGQSAKRNSQAPSIDTAAPVKGWVWAGITLSTGVIYYNQGKNDSEITST